MTIATVLACEMLEDETRLAMSRAFPKGGDPPIVWLESSLHERPPRLRAALDELVHALDVGAKSNETVAVRGVRPDRGPHPQDRREESVPVAAHGDIVLGFGFCGGGLKGLASESRRLVFPRVDDCVSLLLHDNGGDAARDPRSYYLTKGWFCHNSSVTDSFEPLVARYGPERARTLRRLAFANYERVSLIDTGAYNLNDWIPEGEAFAADLDLATAIVRGSIGLLERLFVGEWEADDIVVLDPGIPADMRHILGRGA